MEQMVFTVQDNERKRDSKLPPREGRLIHRSRDLILGSTEKERERERERERDREID